MSVHYLQFARLAQETTGALAEADVIIGDLRASVLAFRVETRQQGLACLACVAGQAQTTKAVLADMFTGTAIRTRDLAIRGHRPKLHRARLERRLHTTTYVR